MGSRSMRRRFCGALRWCSDSLRFAALAEHRAPSAPVDWSEAMFRDSGGIETERAFSKTGSERSERTGPATAPKAPSRAAATPHTPHCDGNRGLCSFRGHAWCVRYARHTRTPQRGPR